MTSRRIATASLLLVIAFSALPHFANSQFEPGRACFCRAGEAVDACPCGDQTTRTLDDFNNREVFPRLQRLLKRTFFKYYKVNMDKGCPFWPDDSQCGTSKCGIEFCDDQVPDALKRPITVQTEQQPESDNCIPRADKEQANAFDPLDMSLSDGEKKRLADWDVHDDLEHKFCESDDDSSTDAHYVDLSRNPERYTGYKGNSAQRIWTAIYQENCFKPDMKFDKNFLLRPNTFGMCLEKRVFYRLISGLHSAITISIASYNYKPAPGGFGEGSWWRNVDMFANRFGTRWSWEGPQRLRNVYFTFLLEARALLKAAPYLARELFFTGNEAEDEETRSDVEELLNALREYANHFDEHDMFTGSEARARSLREEFRQHFWNVSRIMDCVGCDKCRLWGKVQTHGMGTALKILFADLPYSHHHQQQLESADARRPLFQLTRAEVVALFQSFGRYSSSIREVAEFRSEMAAV